MRAPSPPHHPSRGDHARPGTHLVGVALAIVLLAGCGAGQDPTTSPPENDDADVTAGQTTVDIIDNDFSPDRVEIAAGDTVEWTNTGALPHTVTFTDGPDSGSLDSGETFSHTFAEAGELAYACSIHPAMQGTVVVTE